MSESPPCTYRVLEGNIHECVVHQPTRRAADFIFDITAQLLKDDITKAYPGLIDLSVGSLPLDYMLQRARQTTRQFPTYKRAPVAVLAHSNTLFHTAMVLLRPILPIRIYKPSEREQALAWLRESQLIPKR